MASCLTILASVFCCLYLHFRMLNNTTSDLDVIPYFLVSMVACGRHSFRCKLYIKACYIVLFSSENIVIQLF